MTGRGFKTFCLPRSPGGFISRILTLLLVAVLVSYFSGLIFTVPTDSNNKRQVSFKVLTGKTAPGKRFESACVFPKLELNDSAIMKFYKKFSRVECDPGPEWVSIHRGRFIITYSAAKAHPNIVCDAFPIVKVTDFRTDELSPIRNIQNRTKLDNDFYRVHCNSSDGSEYKNFHAGIHVNSEVKKRPIPDRMGGLGLDVIMLGLDSTSRLSWHRHLPKTRDFFVNFLNGTELQGYNILGDGTPAAIMPILLGHIEEELPEARRGYSGAEPVDHFPWIWNEFKKAGYATAWGEDDAALGTFQYRLLGFKNQPTDHYYRYFSLAYLNHQNEFKPSCLGSRPHHTVMFDYMKEMFYAYPGRRKWIFSFQSELSHKDNNYLSMMDDDTYEYIKQLHDEGFLNKAIFIMMADHGGRFSKVRATAQGKQEERLPYMGIRFPQWFHKQHPEIISNIKINSKRLTTPFDVHETMHEILNFTGTGEADISKRGVSLFKRIPKERDCDAAHIDPHWCSCLDWKVVDPKSAEVQAAVREVVSLLNNFTASYRDRCALLGLNRIESASSLQAKEAVLKFRDTNDGGRGRFGVMDDKTKHSRILYQITFYVSPGSGRFEVTVNRDITKDKYTVTSKDISRTNRYGDDPKCVESEEPFLRPYCYCKNRLKVNDAPLNSILQ